MNKQSILKYAKIVGIVLLLGVGAYFGVDTSQFIGYLKSVPEQVQVEAPPVPVAPAFDAGI